MDFDVANLFLPVRSITLIMGGFLLLVLAFVFGALAINHRRLWWSVAYLCMALWVAEICWIFYAACQPAVVETTVDYEVKLVTFPDGKQMQMFHVDGQNLNANGMFECLVPEGYVVRRYLFRRVYCGIYYADSDSCVVRDRYEIVLPGKASELPPKFPGCGSRP